MDHSLPEIRTPWRTATLVASAVAANELFVLVGVGVVLLAKPVSQHVQQAAQKKVFAPVKVKPRVATPIGKPKLTRAETSVIVLNGNGRSGAAHESADLVRARGYLIGSVGNAPRTDFARSIVMYRPGYKPEALRLAKDVGVRIVTPLDGLTQRDLLGAHLALVIGE